MPIRTKVIPEADRGEFSSLGDTLAGDVIGSFSRGIASGLPSALGPAVGHALSSSLSSATTSAGGFSAALGGLSTAAIGATAGVAAIGAAAVIAGQQLYDWGQRWDDITDKLIVRTGLADDAINSLKDSVRDIGSVTAAPLEQIGAVLGDVTVSFHQTGAAADALTQNIVNMQNLLGQEIDTRGLARVFDLFDVTNAADQLDLLDELYSISKSTKIPIDDLARGMQNTGRAAKDLGLDAAQTAGLIATLEQAGLSWEKTGQAMTFAVRSAAKSHQDLGTFLSDTITKIQELNAAGKENEAVLVAQAAFGGRGYIDMYNAISTYKLGVDDLTRAFDDQGSTIAGDIARTQDWDAAWKKFTNTLSGLVQPAATGFFNYVSGFLSTVTQLTDSWTKAWDNLFGTIHTNAPITADDLAGIQAGLGTGPYAPGAPGSLAPITPSTAGDAWANMGGTPTSPPALGGWSTPQGWNRSDTGTSTDSSGRPGAPAIPLPADYNVQRPGESLEDFQRRQQLAEAENSLAQQNARLAQMQEANNDADQKNDFTRDEIVAQQNAITQAEARVYALQHQTNQQHLDEIQVPYGPGYGAAPRPGETSEQYSKEQAALEATHKRQQEEAQLAQIRADPASSPNDIIKAENDLATARQNEYQAMLRLSDSTGKASEQLGDIGVQLDKDFGASEGLPGLAENLFKFLANLAFAPVMGAMRGVQAGLGFPGGQGSGSGLAGIIGSALLPGTQLGTSQQGTSLSGPASASALGPTGLQPAAQTGAQMPYGLTPEQVAAGQFPPEIMQMAAAFGLTPSTYPGHQSTASNAWSQLGVPIAPNPQGLNRGIDWTGSQADMDRFSQFLINSGYPGLEQVIHRDPNTGQNYSYPSGVNYPFGEETGMVHTRFSSIPSLTPGASGIRANQQTGSSGNLIAALQQAGIDPRMYPLIQAFSAAEGRNPSGVPTLGFTDSQAGPTLGQHSQALAEQLRSRQSVAGPFPYGGTRQEQAAWMATVVGQQGVQSDWQGRAQPPRDAYIGSILQNWPGMEEGGPVLPGGAVPIIAHQGEHVLPKEDVDAMGGQDAVYSFRAGLQAANAGNAPPPGQQPATPQQVPGAQMPDVSGTAGGPLPPGAPIGSAPPPQGYGSGFKVTGGGLVGMLESLPSTAINYAISAGMMAAAGAAEFGGAIEDLPSYEGGGGVGAPMGGSPGGASSMGGEPAGALISAAINIAMEELNAAISAGGQAIAAGVGGLQQTFGLQQFAQTSLGQQSWITRLVGGFMGAQPQLPNLAGLKSIPPPASTGTAVSEMTGKRGGGPLVNIQNYHAASDHAAGADIARHVEAGYAASSAALNGGR